MCTLVAVFRRTLRIGCQVALVWGACTGLSGCNSCGDFLSDLRGEGCHDETSAYCRRFRKPDSNIEATSFSNKARDIERDLGAP